MFTMPDALTALLFVFLDLMQTKSLTGKEVVMNPVEIQQRRLELEHELEIKKLELDTIYSWLVALQAECKHPGMRVEDEDYCPDCGYLKR